MGGIKEDLAEAFRSLGIASTIAMAMVFSTFAGVLAGYYLDTWLFRGRTYPWLTLVCLFLGIAGGFKNFLLLSKRFKERGEAPQGADRTTKKSQSDDKGYPQRKSG